MKDAVRRGSLRATALLYGYRALASALIAYPAARTLASFGPSRHPAGDRILFSVGGTKLYEALRLGGSSIVSAVESGVVVGGVLAVVALLPLGATLALLIDGAASRGALARRSIELLPTLLALTGATLLVQGLLAAAGIAGTRAVWVLTSTIHDERLGDLVALIALVAALIAIAAVGLWEDLARVSAALGNLRAVDAARAGLRALVERPLRLAAAYAVLAGCGVVVIGLAAVATGALDVSRPGAFRVVAVFAVHQAALLALAALRVRWLRIGFAQVGWPRASGDGLPVHLHVAASGTIPTEVETHDSPSQ